MSAQHVAVDVLVGAGATVELIACFGVAAMRDAYDRLHFVGPSALGALLIGAGVIVRSGPSIIGLKAVLIAAFAVGTSGVIAHVIARAARISETGDWTLRPNEAAKVEEE